MLGNALHKITTLLFVIALLALARSVVFADPGDREGVGIRTRQALAQELGAPLPLVAAQSDPPAKRIEVIVAKQRLITWEDDRQVMEFAVTTGEEDSPTVEGEFEILDKIEQDAYSTLWGMTMPYWMGIYEVGEYENGFHALPIMDDGEIVWGDALGKFPASHGCIVLSNEDAQQLFHWAEVGTKVEIHQ